MPLVRRMGRRGDYSIVPHSRCSHPSPVSSGQIFVLSCTMQSIFGAKKESCAESAGFPCELRYFVSTPGNTVFCFYPENAVFWKWN